MNNIPDILNHLSKEAHQTSIDHGFWNASQNVGEKLMLINTELAEFFERYRKDDNSPDEHCPEFMNQTIELADTMIRVLDLARWLSMHNIGDALVAKMEYNKTRPYLHGKKF